MDEEPCLPGSLVRQWQQFARAFFHVLITRGDTRRCTKKRPAARSCGPAIRATECVWREERGLSVGGSARVSGGCVRARQQRYQRWCNSLNTQWQSRARSCGIIYPRDISFFRSLASTCVNSRMPRARQLTQALGPLTKGRHQPGQTTAATRHRSTLETRPGATRAVPEDRALPRPMIAWQAPCSSRFCFLALHVSPSAVGTLSPR